MNILKAIITSSIMGFIFLSSIAMAATEYPAIQSYQQFEEQMKNTIKPLAGKEITGLKVLYLSTDVGPWVDTGLKLKAGDRVSWVINGKLWLSRSANLSMSAPWVVWGRIGEKGSIFRGTRETNTFTATTDGSLYLKPYPNERWIDKSGNYAGEPALVNPDGGGGASVAIIKWGPNINIEKELQKLAKENFTGWESAELDRLKNKKLPPPGWNYIWELSDSEMFYETSVPSNPNAPQNAIELNMHDDAMIMEKATDIDLTPETVLSWKWKVDKLPSQMSENTLPTHDYMSIAVKFDNGRDLTFFWSKDLPIDTFFHCPLPGWDFRETHVVARSGTTDLKKWISDEKNIMDYYKKAIGGPLPKKITHVWLIGVSFLQHVDGISQFGDIKLKNKKDQIQVY